MTNFYSFDKLNNKTAAYEIFTFESKRNNSEEINEDNIIYFDHEKDITLLQNLTWQKIVKAFDKRIQKTDFTIKYFDEKYD